MNGIRKFSSARYTTDVCFQQFSCPIGRGPGLKPWFSRRHKLYGYKIEVTVHLLGWQPTFQIINEG